jgi:hypothetical protein
MSVDRFTDNDKLVKDVTNREGDGLGRYDGPQELGATVLPYYEISVKERPGAASDSTITHTGPGAGNMPGIGSSTDLQGFVSATGNKVIVDNTFGADKIILQHHSGSTILIDSDGSIHMVSTGKKGISTVAPTGDNTVYARKHLILKGDGRISLETEGDLDINVGGSLNIDVGGDFVVNVGGSKEESIDGSVSFECAKDMSTMIAGDYRVTSAGKFGLQSPKSVDIDTGGPMNIRSDSTLAINGQDNVSLNSNNQIRINSQDSTQIKSKGLMSLQSQKSFSTRAKETYKISAGGALSLNGSSTLDVLATGKVQIKGSATDIQIGGSPNVDDPTDIDTISLAQYPDSNTVIDNITSLREAPDFPMNANKMSAEKFALYELEGGNPNPKAKARAFGNKGAGMQYKNTSEGVAASIAATGAYDRPGGSVTNNGKAEQNPLPVPNSIFNTNEKISRHVTVGQIINIRACPPSQQKEVLKEAMNVAWNVIDPLFEKFGSRVQLTSWYRDNSANHVKGGAVDLRCSNKPDFGFTAEIAAYIRDNLPYNKLLLEKNDQGGIHVHVESAKPGQNGGGIVLTCADPKCQSTQQGLQLSFAVAALQGRTA